MLADSSQELREHMQKLVEVARHACRIQGSLMQHVRIPHGVRVWLIPCEEAF